MGQFWTVANALSFSRILLVAPITWLIYKDGPIGPMFGLIGLAIATDFFDGRVARWSHTVSEWGKVLDATADKITAACVTIALLIRPAEPNLALASGPDGLDAIRRLARDCIPIIDIDGLLILEHGNEQQDAVAEILGSNGWRDIACFDDYAGNPRVTSARPKASQHDHD